MSFRNFNCLSFYIKLDLVTQNYIKKKITDYGDDELFLPHKWLTSAKPYFQLGLLSKDLTIVNFQHAARRIQTFKRPELWLS